MLEGLRSQITENKRKTVVLLAVFLVILGGMSYFLGLFTENWSITLGALIGSLAYAAFSYFGAAKTAMTITRAKEITRGDNPTLWNVVDNIVISQGMPMPKVYVLPDSGLNAFATGRGPNDAHVAITQGLLDKLDKAELEGVMAHEISHVKNYDIRVSTVVFGLVLAISLLADIFIRMTFFSRGDRDRSGLLSLLGFVGAFLAPLIATVVQASISRQREYLADATGAEMTRFPDGLIRALRKLESGSNSVRGTSSANSHLFIASPLSVKGLTKLMSTHPPIPDRIQRLEEMKDTV